MNKWYLSQLVRYSPHQSEAEVRCIGTKVPKAFYHVAPFWHYSGALNANLGGSLRHSALEIRKKVWWFGWFIWGPNLHSTTRYYSYIQIVSFQTKLFFENFDLLCAPFCCGVCNCVLQMMMPYSKGWFLFTIITTTTTWYGWIFFFSHSSCSSSSSSISSHS